MHVGNVLNLKNNHLIVYKLNQDEDEHHFDEEIDYQHKELVDKHVLHYEERRWSRYVSREKSILLIVKAIMMINNSETE